MHLRSIPIGMRVATWLDDEYPELRKLQRKTVDRELKEAEAGLQPEIRATTPEAIYRATQAINAAYAQFWTHQYRKPAIAQPYVRAGFRTDAANLLEIWQQVPTGPAHDRELVDRWANALGLNGWYQWVPYQPPA